MPKKKNVKKILIIVVILFALILGVRELALNAIERAKLENKTYTSISDFTSVKEIAKYMGCTYIKEEPSTGEKYDIDIYLKFKYPLYTDEVSNEDYYYKMIALMLEYLNYQNIRLIDQENDIVIAVECDKENKEIENLLINGEDNYFGTQENLKELKKYAILSTTKLEIQSTIINQLIEQSWKYKQMNFGSKESEFDGYEIYFDEGLEIKKAGKKVLNIVFTEKYLENIVSGLKVNDSQDYIINQLGDPTFKSEKNSLIGYKGEKIYVFFSKNRVSIYPIEKDYEDMQFISLVNNFVDYADFKTFVNGLTDIWPDYDYYEYGDDYVNISYITKGFKVQYNVYNSKGSGILLYNNYNGSLIERLKSGNEKTTNIYYDDSDLVYTYENEQVSGIHNYEKAYWEYKTNKMEVMSIATLEKERPRYEKDSSEYFVVIQESGIKIISIDNTEPNSEIKEDIYTYFWLDNENLMYSIKSKGIYKYNLKTQQKNTIIEGNDNFYILDYQDGKIYFDDRVMIYMEGMNLPSNYSSTIWLDNNNLAYSIDYKGIYRYNIQNKETQTIIEGNEVYKLEKYENSQLYYNGTSIIYILN